VRRVGVPRPDPSVPDEARNAYVFERAVTFLHGDGTTSAGRIDLYKRGCFALEAKQGTEKAENPALPLMPPKPAKKGALEAAIEYRVREGLDIPEPGAPAPGQHPVAPPIRTALKMALYQTLRESEVSKSELARRLDLDEQEARRILDPRHATRLPTMEKALRALGKHVEVRVGRPRGTLGRLPRRGRQLTRGGREQSS
jgi:hypothetical protein